MREFRLLRPPLLNLFAQPADVNIDRARSDEPLLAPHLIQQLIAPVGITGVGQKKIQQAELAGGEVEFGCSFMKRRWAARGSIRNGPSSVPATSGSAVPAARECALTRAINSRRLNGSR